MSGPEPFVFGPFSVDSEGRLSPAHADLSPGFSVRWRGLTVHARLTGAAPSSGRLDMHTILGRIPSSAAGAAARAASLAMLKDVPGQLPSGWRLRLMPDHRPRLDHDVRIPLPVTVSGLVAELSAFLLELSPWLELFDRTRVWG